MWWLLSAAAAAAALLPKAVGLMLPSLGHSIAELPCSFLLAFETSFVREAHIIIILPLLRCFRLRVGFLPASPKAARQQMMRCCTYCTTDEMPPMRSLIS